MTRRTHKTSEVEQLADSRSDDSDDFPQTLEDWSELAQVTAEIVLEGVADKLVRSRVIRQIRFCWECLWTIRRTAANTTDKGKWITRTNSAKPITADVYRTEWEKIFKQMIELEARADATMPQDEEHLCPEFQEFIANQRERAYRMKCLEEARVFPSEDGTRLIFLPESSKPRDYSPPPPIKALAVRLHRILKGHVKNPVARVTNLFDLMGYSPTELRGPMRTQIDNWSKEIDRAEREDRAAREKRGA